MVYFLKFCASFVLPPGIFFLLLFGISYYLYKKLRATKIALFIFTVTFLFYLLSTNLVAGFLIGNLESVYEPPKSIEGDVIVMLGGGAFADTPDIDGEGTLCAAPSARLLTALRLYHKLKVPIILSGGQVYEDTGAEAKIARRLLLSLGVPENDIITEDKSVNTTQNAKFTAKIMNERGFHRPIVVTSAFHMRRAMLNFKNFGYEAVPMPTDYMSSKRRIFHYTKLRPQSEALYQSVTVFQELLRTKVTELTGR
ncbi:MAG: YdcF family protein [Selenomonadaceae bacterium]|nr:YdcF family protein [Selenomonadaceae bacterium]